MTPISGVNTGTVQPLATAERALGASKVHRPEKEAQGRRLKPMMDEYVPEEPQEPSGRYWMGKDEDSRPKIYFDGPEQAAGAPKKPGAGIPGAEEPEKGNKGTKELEKAGKKEERCIGDTGRADREIERLKKKRQDLERRLNTETDKVRIKDLKRRLARVERELKQKDNDTYRKQHSTFTRLS